MTENRNLIKSLKRRGIEHKGQRYERLVQNLDLDEFSAAL